MTKGLFLCLLLLFLLFSCSNTDKKSNVQSGSAPTRNSNLDKQLNISVLWDLSDRINPAIHHETPSNADRDVAIIKYLANYFKQDMRNKGAYLSKGKLKVFFSPNPTDPNINSLASKLDVDLSNKDIKDKKEVYDHISSTFEQTAKEITDLTIKTSRWQGSDIYRFFKNDVADYCISSDTSYKNILVLITDGYIYSPQSMEKIGNKSEYISSSLLTSLHLRNNPNFKSVFKKDNCGLISTRNDLDGLEILVLEINSNANHKDDEDIIKLYLQDWFTKMRVKRFEIYNTDLPDNTKTRIAAFLNHR